MPRIPGSASRPAGQSLDLVGLGEISVRLGVPRPTVDQWRTRGVLPDPGWELAGGPIWTWQEIRQWAERTDRIPESPNGRAEPSGRSSGV